MYQERWCTTTAQYIRVHRGKYNVCRWLWMDGCLCSYGPDTHLYDHRYVYVYVLSLCAQQGTWRAGAGTGSLPPGSVQLHCILMFPILIHL